MAFVVPPYPIPQVFRARSPQSPTKRPRWRSRTSPQASLLSLSPLIADLSTFVGPTTYVGPSVTEVAAALAGGTVGVMGTLIALEVVVKRAKERKQCPYCRGTGRLPCGACYTLGGVPSRGGRGGERNCEECTGSGFLMCNHCEGSGRLIPIEYERALRAQYDDYVYTSFEDDYFGVNDGPPYL